jgi:hypothetical protein
LKKYAKTNTLAYFAAQLVTKEKQFNDIDTRLARSCSTVAEHSPHYSKVQGLSPASEAVTGREKVTEKVLKRLKM